MTTLEETMKVEELNDEYEEVPLSITQESSDKIKKEVDSCEKTAEQSSKYCLRTRKRKVYSEAKNDPDEKKSPTHKTPKDLLQWEKYPLISKPKTKRRKNVRIYTCDQCGQNFRIKGWYHRHIDKVHKGKKEQKSLTKGQKDISLEPVKVSYEIDMKSLGDININLEPDITMPELTKLAKRIGDNDQSCKTMVKEPLKIGLHPIKNKDYGTRKESNPDCIIIDDIEKKLPAKNSSNFCSICSQYFSSENELDEHDCNVFSCDQCVRIFRNQESLDRHFDLHATDNHKILFDCEHCHRVFKRKSDVINHSRQIHKIEVLFF